MPPVDVFVLAVHPGRFFAVCSLVLKIHTPVIATDDDGGQLLKKRTGEPIQRYEATALNPTSADGTGWEPNYYQLGLEL